MGQLVEFKQALPSMAYHRASYTDCCRRHFVSAASTLMNIIGSTMLYIQSHLRVITLADRGGISYNTGEETTDVYTLVLARLVLLMPV